MKSRKVLTILLSLAIMVTFMPTFAFAGAPTGTNHKWKLDETKSVKATCTTGGYNVYVCEKEGCNTTYAETTSAAHVYPDNGIRYTVAEYMEAVIAEGASDQELNRITTDLENNCYVYAKACKACNKLQKDANGHYVYDKGTSGAYGHTRSKDTAECAESYKCDFCGKTVEDLNVTHDYTGQTWTKVADNVCAKNLVEGSVDGVNVEKRTCAKCGKEEKRIVSAVEFTDTVATNSSGGTQSVEFEANKPFSDDDWTWDYVYHHRRYDETLTRDSRTAYMEAHVAHNVTPVNPQPKADDPKDAYIQYNGQYYLPTEVKDSDCKTAGYKKLVCACGVELASEPIAKKTTHSWKTIPVAATCTSDAYSVQYCPVCNAFGTKTYGDKKLGHDYEVVVASEPNCEYDGLTIITCKRCGETINSRQTDFNTYFATVGKVIYFEGFDGELYDSSSAGAAAPYAKCIEVKDWKKSTHKWSAYKDYTEATCEEAATQARQCEVCGSFSHSDVKSVGEKLGHDIETITVAPTCGEQGYSYDTCLRCKQYINHTTKLVNGEGALNAINKYDVKEPVVAKGTECKYEWGSLDENTDALICKNCGAVKVGSETPKTEDAKKAAAVENAKPAIEAAADVLSNSATYTADSVKAVEEAKNNLNIAIASGTAADVKAMAAELEKAVASATEKVANAVTAKGKTIKVKAKKGKVAKNKTVKKAVKASNAAGKVTFKKANKAGGSKIVVKANGAVTVKKGLKKGTYKVAVTANAKGDGNTLAGTAKATVKVVVK